MANPRTNVVCIGRGSTISRHESRLVHAGYSLHLVGSIDEYLRVTDQLGAEVVFVGENFDASARQSVAHWVRHSTPVTRVFFLYEHHSDDAVYSEAFVNVADAKEVLKAVQAASSPRGVRIHQGA
jgi:hypothetical protein